MTKKNKQRVKFVITSWDGGLEGEEFFARSEEEANKKLCDIVIHSSADAAYAESADGRMTASAVRVKKATVHAKRKISKSRVCGILARAGFVADPDCEIEYEKNDTNKIEVLTAEVEMRHKVRIK